MKHRKPRKPRPNERYQGYDSKFEHDLHKGILRSWEAHPKEKVEYRVIKHYNPDFKKELDGKVYYIEAKGRFWDSDEYSKYKWARESLQENEEIIFIFYNPNTPMPRAKARKDGTKVSHGEWATDNNFQWYTEETFPQELM